MIQTPCKGCKRRNLGCHDPEYCPEWGKYQEEKAAFEQKIKAVKAKEKITDDYRSERIAITKRKKENHHAG